MQTLHKLCWINISDLIGLSFSEVNVLEQKANGSLLQLGPKLKSCFPMSLTSSLTFVTEINMAEYGDGRSTSSRDVLSAITMRLSDEHFSLFTA